MTVNFRFNNGGTDVDFDDVFIRRDLFAQGNLWAWGFNSAGQLGNNAQGNRSSPVQTISGGLNWKLVKCGSYHVTAIKTDGTLWLWGAGASGQLGNNARTNRSSPVQTVSGGSNWYQVSGGDFHTGAIKTDGTLWMWGFNQYGQLGNNAQGDRSSPVQTVSGGSNWKQVSCGSFHTGAIKTDGTLWTWGEGLFGQLGFIPLSTVSSPVQTVAGGTNWKQVSCGASNSAAIKTDGTLWLWGENTNGQIGDNGNNAPLILISSPIQTVSGGTNWKLVDCSYGTVTAAIKTDGTLWTWGRNDFGQLGDNTQIDKSSPVQTISGGTNWKQVTCGIFHTVAIKTDGTLWLWGLNSDFFGDPRGALGDNQNAITARSSPVQTISGGTNWKLIGAGRYNTAATTDLDVY